MQREEETVSVRVRNMSLGFPVFGNPELGSRPRVSTREHPRLRGSPRCPDDNVTKAKCTPLLEPQFLPWQNLFRAKFLLSRREEGPLMPFLLASCGHDRGASGSEQEEGGDVASAITTQVLFTQFPFPKRNEQMNTSLV